MAEADFDLEWSGGLRLTANNDIQMATNIIQNRQKIIRGLLTAQVVTDSNGIVVLSANNIFDPKKGAGLSRDVDGVDDSVSRADKETRARAYLANERVIDQTQPITINWATNRTNGSLFMLIKLTTIDNEPLTLGLA